MGNDAATHETWSVAILCSMFADILVMCLDDSVTTRSILLVVGGWPR